MVDYQRLVSEIRSFLQSSDWTSTEPLREPAAAFADVCREANERLRRCEEFLHKGLRSEALHLAQAEPALLDLVATLDFPERPQWEEVTMTYGLAAAPKLQLGAAEALNKAYAEDRPLEHLLRRHRLLALTRAPLRGRLVVLRSIAEVDTRNPVWADDITVFEQARLRQMEKEVDDAAGRNDTAALAGLREEVHKSQWRVAPPNALATAL